jgi:hypothetical protein
MEARDKDNIDQWLDSALRQYGNAEPRSGLEGRMVTRLAAELQRQHATKRWLWGLASAACLIVAIWIGLGYRRLTPAENIDVLTADFTKNLSIGPAWRRTLPVPPVAARRRTRHTHALRATADVAEPRLNQFPAPRPLSEEELLFANYADRFPKEAMVLAQEQHSFEDGTRRAEQDARNSIAVSH